MLNKQRSTLKNLEATFLFVDFPKPFDFIHRRKMVQIILAYNLKKPLQAIMMLNKNTKAMVHLPDDDIDYFDIVSGGLLEDLFATGTYQDYLLRTSIDLIKENEGISRLRMQTTQMMLYFSQIHRPTRIPGASS